jgi:acyl-CoA thioesterase-1
MQSVMRIVAFEFAGGDAFFVGLALLAAATLLAVWRDGPRIRAAVRLMTFCAWIVLIPSATPLPLWFYGVGLLLTVLTLFARSSRRTAADRVALAARPPVGFAGASEDTGGQAASATPSHAGATSTRPHLLRRISGAALLLLCWCLGAAGWEFSCRLPPRLDNQKSYETLIVIGDSVSAGLNGRGEPTWPLQFRERYFGSVLDLSAAGATARLAQRQAKVVNERLPDRDAVILIEIGGNDFFESVPPAEFEEDLERLLSELERPNRQLVMLELPLPPFYNAYGHVQRDVAARRHVPLISKREFAEVVFAPQATLDTVHLSPAGHRLFADMVWRHVGAILHTPAVDSMTLYSIKPEETSAGDAFYHYVVRNKVDVASPEDRAAIFTAIQQGIDQGYAHGAFGCFEPHHGVRLRRKGKAHDYVLCFECLNVDEFIDGKFARETTMDWTAQALIDKHLKEAGVLQAKH